MSNFSSQINIEARCKEESLYEKTTQDFPLPLHGLCLIAALPLGSYPVPGKWWCQRRLHVHHVDTVSHRQRAESTWRET